MCGGKAKVVKLREKIRRHPDYFNSYCMFFVDADFDDNSEISSLPDMYITPCYSVENLYMSEASFSRIMSAEFGVNEFNNKSCYTEAIEKYRAIKSGYVEAIRPFNALLRELRTMEKNGEMAGRLNINNVKFDALISVNLYSSPAITKNYDENDPLSIFPELPETVDVDISNSMSFLRRLSGCIWLRGKQNIEFLRRFLFQVKQDRCNKENRVIFKEKGGVKLQLTKSNCMSELSQYADTPDCLRFFLERQPAL